jgi:ABC-type glycerol-3-phosphate transport system substrate-binding protein
MKLKKFWSLLLVAMLAMSLLAACGSSTESEEPEEET